MFGSGWMWILDGELHTLLYLPLTIPCNNNRVAHPAWFADFKKTTKGRSVCYEHGTGGTLPRIEALGTL